MSRHPLDRIQVAKPCPVSWDSMSGDDRVRFCGACRLNVFNLSGMTRREATELLQLVEGRLCVRFFRRKDGTLLTSDCPVGMGWTGVAARAAAFLIAATAPFWGTLAVIHWRDIQVTVSGWVATVLGPKTPVRRPPVPSAVQESERPLLGRMARPPSGTFPPLDIPHSEAPPDGTPPSREPREVR